ncbi:chimeric ERCC6-PGBD3 protein [Trichonephila clavipes]|nr:chimeric ERCC6-PGBD3 protein [Trichonephila clavipes]
MLFLPQLDKHCRMPTLPERALLVKLYYCNSENAATAVRQFHCLKKQRHGLMSVRALKDVMVKFEKTGQLGVLPGRGRKRVNTTIVEDIVTVEVEASSFQDVAKKVFKTAEEAIEYLFSEELESEMIALPPEVDEEDFDDTETLDPSVRAVAGSIEISVSYENHDDHREADLSNKSKKRSCSESGSNTLDIRKSGFRASGTIRSDRIQHCPLEIDSIFKKTSRGSHDFYFDVKNKITAVKWNDNKCVTLATNFDIIEPLTSVSRHEKGKVEKNKIDQPCLVSNYNKNMGGVDSHDWLLEKHTIKIHGKKWFGLIFTRFVDMAVVNSAGIYNMVNEEKKSIKEIRRHIEIAYLKKGNTVQKQIGRPSYTISSRVKKIATVRHDGVGHIIGIKEKNKDDVKCKIVRENLLHFA